MRYAFRLCLSREPDSVELQRLLDFLNQRQREFVDDPDQANQVAGPEVPKGASPQQLASWTAVSRALLNLDEFLTRE